MKTKLGNPAPNRLVVNFVSAQRSLAERIRGYYAHSKKYSIACSEEPLPESDIDCYVVPFPVLKTLFYSRERPDTWLPVIAYGSHLLVAEAFHLGCRDYLKEPWDFAEFEIRLNNVMRPAWPKGTPPCAPALVLAGNKVKNDGAEAVLKPNEARILKALLKANGEVVSREVLYYAIWGTIKNSSSRVVDVHVSALRRKLKGLSKIKIEQVRGEGYVLS